MINIRQAIAEALAANALAIDEKKLLLLARYADHLLAWNERINLISRASVSEFAAHHIADSVLAAAMLPPVKSLVDLGSGGGLPGIVIAIMRPDTQVTLAETKEKKIKYLQDCAQNLNLQNVRVHDAARERQAQTHEILVCRAFSSLERIVRESKKYLAPKGKMYAYKGRLETAEAEQGALPKKLRCSFTPYTLVNPEGERSERTLVIIET